MSRAAARNAAAAVAALAALLVAAVPAAAATTIGQNSTGPHSCGSPVGQVQGYVANPPSYRVPFDGVITSFTVPHPGAPVPASQVKLLVLDPVSGVTYRADGSSSFFDVGSLGLHTFATSVPVRAGHEIGTYGLSCTFSSPGDIGFAFSGPEPAPGAEQAFPQIRPDRRVNLTATVEPDCDRDGRGDHTQDADLSTCFCRGVRATIVGTSGPEEIRGTPGRDVITARGGRDRIHGAGGNDRICGGGSADRLLGGRGADVLFGQRGADLLKGGPGRDVLRGGPGADREIQ